MSPLGFTRVAAEQLRTITERGHWNAVVNAVVSGCEAPPIDRTAFDTYWIEAGHRIRAQVADDRLMVKFLRQMLQPYSGGPVTLYRGENLNRWRAQSLGFAWTTQVETARMFARGLNAIEDGGVLLRGTFTPQMVICAPNHHSTYLDEGQFTVDPFASVAIDELEQYPPS